MIIKREWSCLGSKRKFENIKENKNKQMRSSRQNDKLEPMGNANGCQRCGPGIDPRQQ